MHRKYSHTCVSDQHNTEGKRGHSAKPPSHHLCPLYPHPLQGPPRLCVLEETPGFPCPCEHVPLPLRWSLSPVPSLRFSTFSVPLGAQSTRLPCASGLWGFNQWGRQQEPGEQAGRRLAEVWQKLFPLSWLHCSLESTASTSPAHISCPAPPSGLGRPLGWCLVLGMIPLPCQFPAADHSALSSGLSYLWRVWAHRTAGTLTEAPHFLRNCWTLAFIEHHLLQGPGLFSLH